MIFSSNGESFEDSFHHAVNQFDLSHEPQGASPELPDDPNRFRQDPDTGMWNRETATDRKRDYVTDMSSKVATGLPQADVDGIVKYIQQSPPSENVEDRRQFDPSQQFMIDNKAVPYKAAPDSPQGQLEPGNIDLNNRPIVKNSDGKISTVRSIGVNIDGKETVIPTVAHDGSRILSNDEAIQQYRDSGLHLGKFDTPENATAYGETLHEAQAKQYTQNVPSEASKLAGETKTIPGYQTWPEHLATTVAPILKEIVDKTNPANYPSRMGKAVTEEIPALANKFVDAFKLPGDVYQGKEDPSSERAIGRAAELAGALVFGPAPIANKVVDGTLGSIAGINAKTADKSLQQVAEVLHQHGYGTEEIWKTTGWYKGSEGKWRFEIPTNKAEFVEPKVYSIDSGKHITDMQPTVLSKALDFPELYKAYPELKDIPLVIDNNIKHLGVWDGEKIALNLGLIKQSGHNPTDIILHEAQHVIQQAEGFQYGTTLKNIIGDLREQFAKAKTPEEKSQFKELMQKYLLNDRNRNAIQNELWRRIPGEREAQVVEARSLWNAKERNSESPLKTLENWKDTPAYQSKVFSEER